MGATKVRVEAAVPTYPDDLEPAMREELAILASIEARYEDELARLEQSVAPPSMKERLRVQLEERRKLSRHPHCQRLAALHQNALSITLFRSRTRH
jgi:hypothetical protein